MCVYKYIHIYIYIYTHVNKYINTFAYYVPITKTHDLDIFSEGIAQELSEDELYVDEFMRASEVGNS